MVNNIFILNKYMDVVSVLNINTYNTFFDDLYSVDFSTGAESFEFSTNISSKIYEGFYVMLMYHNQYKLFQIIELEEDHSEGKLITTCYCEAACLGLLNNVVRPFEGDMSCITFLDTILYNTGWEVGYCSDIVKDKVLTVDVSKATNVWSLIQEYMSKFGYELSHRVEYSGGKITGLYLDIHGEGELGTATYKRFEYGRNTEGITRKKDLYDWCTAIIIDGIDVSNISFDKDGFSKGVGSDTILAEDANFKYNNGREYIYGVYESNEKERQGQEAIDNALEELRRRSVPHLDYEVTTAMTYDEYMDINIGDTVYVIDHEFGGQDLLLEARIGKLEISFTDRTKCNCTLTNYKTVKSKIQSLVTNNGANFMGVNIGGYINSEISMDGDDIKITPPLVNSKGEKYYLNPKGHEAEDVLLGVSNVEGTVTQSFIIDYANNCIYTTQVNGAKADGNVLLTQMDLNGNILGKMYLNDFGHGSQINLTHEDSTVYIWLECDGVLHSNGFNYGTRFCRFEFKNGATVQGHTGKVYDLIPGATRLSISISEETNRIAVRFADRSGNFYINTYKLDSLVGRDNTEAIGINADLISSISIDKKLHADKQSHQGLGIYGDYIYYLTGVSLDANNGVNNSKIRCIDLNGNILYEHLITHRLDLTYREPECLYIRQVDDETHEMYFGFASDVQYARKLNIFKYSFTVDYEEYENLGIFVNTKGNTYNFRGGYYDVGETLRAPNTFLIVTPDEESLFNVIGYKNGFIFNTTGEPYEPKENDTIIAQIMKKSDTITVSRALASNTTSKFRISLLANNSNSMISTVNGITNTAVSTVSDWSVTDSNTGNTLINGASVANGSMPLDKLDQSEVDRFKADTVEASKIITQELIATKADITDLHATNATIENLKANKADIEYLTANYATIQQLNATNANIGTLTADVADIQTLVNGHLTSDNIQSLILTSDKVTVANAFIKDAMIDTVSASKINTGQINTNNVSIQSEDGSMLLQGNLQQFKDANGNVRIQIGKDTTGNFTFVLYGEDGQGQLIDQTGIKASAVSDGLIVNAMINDEANITGSKLDINSVISSINNGTTVIKGTRVQLDEQGQSLEVAFSQLKTKVDTIEEVTIDGDLSSVIEQVTANTTNIGIAQGQISSLISNTTITKANGEVIQLKDEYNSTKDTVNSHTITIGLLQTDLSTVTSKQTKLEQTLDGFKATVSETYATKGTVGGIESRVSTVEQTASSLTSKFTDGYTMGIIEQNASGIKVYHNQYTGENYTHMSPAGFYLKYKGTDVFKVDSNGLTIQGYTTSDEFQDLSDTYYSGYTRGITQINDLGVKVYHNSIDSDSYTHMSPSGFYTKYKGTDVFQVDSNGIKLDSYSDDTNWTNIQAGYIECGGTLATRGWMGETYTDHTIKLKSENGKFRARNDYTETSLYMGDRGLSTTADANLGSTGVIDFHSYWYDSANKGLVMYSNHHVGLVAYNGPVNISPEWNNRGNNTFSFQVLDASTGSARDTDGMIYYGSHVNGYSTCIRVSKDASEPGIDILNGDGTTKDAFLQASHLWCDDLNNNHWTNGTLTMNQLSQGAVKGTQTYLSGTTISATNIYQNGSAVSGSDIVLKDNIKEYKDSALDIINQTKVYSFNRILANQDKTEIGFLAQQVPDIFIFDKGEFTAKELDGLTAEDKKALLAKKTEDYKTVLENRKLDEISENVASFYDLDSEQTEKQIERIMDEYHNVEYEVPISTINQNNIIAVMFKAIQELSAKIDELESTSKTH